ncbi:MAG: CBS domain-containing protein [Gammaproteobacteria bacterium]|nr:MAG: CBS domain-containing protein [Gammaproteobacteria bacterium]
MNRAEVVEFLATVAPFSELEREALAEFAERFAVQQHAAGEPLGEFPQPGHHGLFLVREGAVALFDSEDRRLEQRGEGELFGHAIILDGAARDYTVRASEACVLWQLSPQALDEMVSAYPLIGHFLTAAPGERLATLAAQGTGILEDLRLRTPVTVSADTPIAECARLMAERQVSCLPVLRDDELAGIVTDRDLRSRVLARGVDPGTAIAEVMTPQPLTARPDSRIEDALLEMMRLGIHHLPVVDDSRQLVAVISAGDLLRRQSPHPLRLVRDIQRAGDVTELAAMARQGPGLLAALSRQGSEVTEVGRIASMLTDACTLRLLALAQARLGDAPCRWAWLAFGSQARMEQGLVSDQDNGLLLAETPDADGETWFRELADFVCDGLDRCGYVYCPGGVMAKGRWRLSQAKWRSTFAGWMDEPTPESVLNSSIFFDMRGVAGDVTLAERLHEEVLERARETRIFLRFLAAESMTHTPPLGLFRQFVQESDGRQSHGLNLKKRGVLPIVDLARVRALEGAIPAVATEARFRAAAAAGVMSERDAEDLVHAYRFIGNIRLRHQAQQHARGETPGHLVDPESLSGLHRRYLRSAFGIVRSAQRALAQRYAL